MFLENKTSARLMAALGLLIAARVSSAGHFGAITLLATTSHPVTNMMGGGSAMTSSSSSVGTYATASMSCSGSGVANVSGPILAGASAGNWVESQYRVYWTEDYIGEPLPTTIYHHHQIETSAYATYTILSGTSYRQIAVSAYAGVSGALVAAPGTNTASDLDTTITTGICAPTWYYSSVDATGYKTYYFDTPPISDPNVIKTGKINCNLTIWLQSAGTSASGLFDAELSDNFYFSESSIPNF